MELLEALGIGGAPGGTVVALVGAGGKTASLFALGASIAARGGRALLATTTHIRDPRGESGRRFDRVVAEAAFASPPGPAARAAALSLLGSPDSGELPPITVLGSGLLSIPGEVELLASVDPAWPAFLAPSFDLVAVEADGSRSLPVKAPASHEPVMPAGASLVLGLVGLDCLGRPMGPDTVHRPELFGALADCAPGEAIGPRHLLALARSREGLFKSRPSGAARVLVLNKADLVSPRAAAEAFGFLSSNGAADLVILAALGSPEAPSGEVLETSGAIPAVAR